MSNYIKCSKCGREYHDKDSIKMALDLADEWTEISKAAGIDVDGLGPCPIFDCTGEFTLMKDLRK